MAKEVGCLVDTQTYFGEALHHNHSAIAWDHVHANITGHMLLTRASLEGTGFRWNAAACVK